MRPAYYHNVVVQRCFQLHRRPVHSDASNPGFVATPVTTATESLLIIRFQPRLPVSQEIQTKFSWVMLLTAHRTVGISIARMRWLKLDDDMTWWNVTPALWSLGELTSAISCSCLPFFKPLTLRIKSSLNRTTGQRVTAGEGDEGSNTHPSAGAGKRVFFQSSNHMISLDGSQHELVESV